MSKLVNTYRSGGAQGGGGGSEHWGAPVSSISALPNVGNQDGDVRLVKGSHALYSWSAIASAWSVVDPGSGLYAPMVHSHALATATAPGYMSPAHFSRLNAIPATLVSSFTGNPADGARNGPVTLTAADVSGVLGFTPENAGWRGQAGGYAPLNASALVPDANLPADIVRTIGSYANPSWIPSLASAKSTYGHADHPDLANVSQALDKLLFIPLAITSLTNNGAGPREIGSAIMNLGLNWALSKATITGQTLSASPATSVPALSVSDRSATISGAIILQTTTFTLTVTTETETKQASTTISVLPKRYYGASAKAAGALTDADIIAMGSDFTQARAQSRTLNATGGRYLYVVYPASWEVGGDPSFKLGGFAFSGMTKTTRLFTNASGYSQSYVIWQSTLQTGAAMLLEVI